MQPHAFMPMKSCLVAPGPLLGDGWRDHQAFIREFIYEIRDGKYRIAEVVPKEKTVFPPACKFPSA